MSEPKRGYSPEKTEDVKWSVDDLIGHEDQSPIERINLTVKDGFQQERLLMKWIGDEFVFVIKDAQRSYYRVVDQQTKLVGRLSTDQFDDEVKARINKKAREWAIYELKKPWAPTVHQLNTLCKKFRLICRQVDEIHPFLPKWKEGYTLYRCPYEPIEQDTPVFTGMLERLSDKNAVLTWLGGNFLSEYDGRQCIYIYGEGHTGKSKTFGTVMKELFGLNCGLAAFDVNERSISSQFVHQNTYNRPMLFCGEVHNSGWVQSKVYKEVSSGEYVSVEFKNKTPFTAYIRCGVLSCSNSAPLLTRDVAISTRTIPITCAPFGEGELNPDAPDLLKAEMPGILYQILKAWDEVGGHVISYNDSTKTLLNELADAGDECWQDFCDDYLIKRSNGYVKASDLHRLFKVRFSGGNRANQYKGFLKYLEALPHVTKVKRSNNTYEGIHFDDDVRKTHNLTNHDLNGNEKADNVVVGNFPNQMDVGS